MKEKIAVVKAAIKEDYRSGKRLYEDIAADWWLHAPDPCLKLKNVDPDSFCEPDVFVFCVTNNLYDDVFCPNCSKFNDNNMIRMHSHGYRYRRVVAIDRYYYLLYRRLKCKSCDSTIAEHSPDILKQLPV